jgi:hypothetical protein
MESVKIVDAAPRFKDAKGNEWTLSLTLGLTDRVLSATGVDLLSDSGDTGTVLALVFDRRKLANVLWAVLSAEASDRGINQEQFVDALDGEALSNGWGALVDAIVFFTPPQGREVLRAAIESQVAAMEQGVAALAEVAASQATNDAMKEAAGRIKDAMQADLTKALANSAGNLEASSA